MWYEALKISENKISRGCIVQIIITSKLQMQCKKGVYFSCDFGFPSILILSVKNGGGVGRGRGGLFNRQNPKSVKHGKIYLLTVPKYFHKMLYQTTTNPTKI